ncbi:MAG TPA: aminomethyl-transferring glycine dehydrogenase subunit GcvPA [Candidatus Limnocylindria bacterium]|nr:aminomethyl-transferring glycine dehydrogenase subunit GcvPA [Candidatus Limnocylindria bacterium]
MSAYLPHTSDDVAAMLAAIGAPSIEALFAQVPAGLRERARLDLPTGLAEPELRRRFEALAARNGDAVVFAGGGMYPHDVPAVVDHVLQRSEFATAYTPYQPEVSQGTLQAIFEFQTFVALLTGMDVANASMYDGASATAEAVLMARRVLPGRRTVWLSRALHPHYREVVATYVQALDDIVVRELPWNAEGRTDAAAVAAKAADDTLCVVAGYPNVFGVFDDLSALAGAVHRVGGLVISVTTEPLALAVVRPPGACDVDIAVGEGQSFGLPVSYGGPGLGLFATRDRLVRSMPGRIVGETVDARGRRGYVLTLATREQHIRRERATSNICTNQGLCSLAVTVYLSMLGRRGLQALAARNHAAAHDTAARLARAGLAGVFAGPFFNEFVVRVPDAPAVWERLARNDGLVAGVPLGRWYPELSDALLLCVTETHTESQIARLVDVLAAAAPPARARA